MADAFHEIPRSWFEGKIGVEFTLPNISSPWLTKVFQLWNDNVNAAEASNPIADFQSGEDIQVFLPKLADFDSEFDKIGVTLVQNADLSPMEPHPQGPLEQQGTSSSSVSSSPWGETEVVTSCASAQGCQIDYGRGINGEGYGPREVEAST